MRTVRLERGEALERLDELAEVPADNGAARRAPAPMRHQEVGRP